MLAPFFWKNQLRRAVTKKGPQKTRVRFLGVRWATYPLLGACGSRCRCVGLCDSIGILIGLIFTYKGPLQAYIVCMLTQIDYL